MNFPGQQELLTILREMDQQGFKVLDRGILLRKGHLDSIGRSQHAR